MSFFQDSLWQTTQEQTQFCRLAEPSYKKCFFFTLRQLTCLADKAELSNQSMKQSKDKTKRPIEYCKEEDEWHG